MKAPYLRNSEIENMSIRVLNEYYGCIDSITGYEIDIENICEGLFGLDIVPGDLDTDFPEKEFYGAIGALDLSDGAVYIDTNRNNTQKRLRFTVAHEIGHYILHRPLLLQNNLQINMFSKSQAKHIVCRERQSKDQMEWQANQFGAALLMPKPLIVKYVKRIRENWKISPFEPIPERLQSGKPGLTEIISQNFYVSEIAARIRLENLGIIEKLDTGVKAYAL